jgi:hypothetical protein
MMIVSSLRSLRSRQPHYHYQIPHPTCYPLAVPISTPVNPSLRNPCLLLFSVTGEGPSILNSFMHIFISFSRPKIRVKKTTAPRGRIAT